MLSSRSVTLGYMSYIRAIRNVCWPIGRSEDDLHSPGHTGRAVEQRAGRYASLAGVRLDPLRSKRHQRGREGGREGREGGREGKEEGDIKKTLLFPNQTQQLSISVLQEFS